MGFSLFPSTGVGAGDIQNSTHTYAADAEASDAYVIALDPVISAYVDGQMFSFMANTANTGAATLDAGPSALTIKKLSDQDLETGDIEAGQIVVVQVAGSVFQMQSQVASELVVPSATTSVEGTSVLADEGETTGGVVTNKTTTPAGLRSYARYYGFAATSSFSTSTVMANPGGMAWRANNATLSSITSMVIHDDAISGATNGSRAVIGLLVPGDTLIMSQNNAVVYFAGVVSLLTDNGTWFQVDFSSITASFGAFTANDCIALRLAKAGTGEVNIDIQEFTSGGTWTKPANAKACDLLIIAGGGGGGSGRQGAASSGRSGGGGGSPGAVTMLKGIPASAFGATESVTVGAGGTGGSALAGGGGFNDLDGNDGLNGGNSSFFGIVALGGPNGDGGDTTSGIGGAAVPDSLFSNTEFDRAAADGGGGGEGDDGTPDSPTDIITMTPTGGGGGGGVTAANAESAGASGGGWDANVPFGDTVAAGGVVNGGDGGVGPTTFDLYGFGGGGGGGNDDGDAGDAGDGGANGGGGGGGGGSVNASASGAGGDGGDGYVRVITYLEP